MATLSSCSNTYSAHHIDDGSRAIRLLAVVLTSLFAHQRPQLVQVDSWAKFSVLLQMVMPHAHLTEVSWMARI